MGRVGNPSYKSLHPLIPISPFSSAQQPPKLPLPHPPLSARIPDPRPLDEAIFAGSPPMARLTQADLVELNRRFDERTPQELIQWARKVFGSRVAALSSMQMSGNVIAHML